MPLAQEVANMLAQEHGFQILERDGIYRIYPSHLTGDVWNVLGIHSGTYGECMSWLWGYRSACHALRYKAEEPQRRAEQETEWDFDE